MRASPISFDAQFSPGLTQAASIAFRSYLFRRYGFLFGLACFVNAIGFYFAVRLGAEPGPALVVVAFVVALGPTWLLYKYLVGPRLQSLMLRKVLAERGSVSVDDDFVSLPGLSGKSIPLSWFKMQVVDHPSLFLLVRSPFFCYYVPKAGMPLLVQQAFQAKLSSRGA